MLWELPKQTANCPTNFSINYLSGATGRSADASINSDPLVIGVTGVPEVGSQKQSDSRRQHWETLHMKWNLVRRKS